MNDDLIVTAVRSGKRLDRVSLVDGHLTYETGAARSIFDSLHDSRPDLGDAELFALRAGWSNGYITLQSPTDEPTS